MEEGRDGDGVSSMDVSANRDTPLRRSKRLMELSKNIDGRDGVSSMEVSDLDHTKPPCRRGKRLMEFSKLNPIQPLAKKPMFIPTFTCEICTITKPETDVFNVKECNHFYCSACIAKYIKSKIQNNILSITCPQPNCSSSIEPQQSQSILPKTVYNRWCFSLCETLVLETSRGYYCPLERCSALVINELSENCRKCECPHCKRSFCMNCKLAWHRSLTCKEARKNDQFDKFTKLVKRKGWKNCPQCKSYVSKSEGCNHMTCRCRFQFCYRCGEKYPCGKLC